MKPKQYGITLEGGPHHGKSVDGLNNPVAIAGYRKTDRMKDGRTVYEFAHPLLPR